MKTSEQWCYIADEMTLQLSRQKSVAIFDKNNIVIKTSEQRRYNFLKSLINRRCFWNV